MKRVASPGLMHDTGCLGLVGALGRPRGMVRGGRREEGSGWGTRVYLWQIHVDIWQSQYNIVKLKNKIKFKKTKKTKNRGSLIWTRSFSTNLTGSVDNEWEGRMGGLSSKGKCGMDFESVEERAR